VSVPYWSSRDGRIVLHHGDCREVMAGLADKSIDHVHAKSRAGTTKQHNAGKGQKIDYARDLGFDHLSPELRALCSDQFARVCRRWVLAFCDVEGAHGWISDVKRSGLDYVRTGAWVKLGCTPQFTGDRPGSGYEAVVMGHPKGKKRWNGGGRQGVWSYPVVAPHFAREERIHTTQKPLQLIRDLVSLFTDPGDLILDPFAGSATTLVAAYEQGRRAIGVEMDAKNAEAARRRLQAMDAQGSLFGVASGR
jgi:hypothetical protein